MSGRIGGPVGTWSDPTRVSRDVSHLLGFLEDRPRPVCFAAWVGVRPIFTSGSAALSLSWSSPAGRVSFVWRARRSCRHEYVPR
jgi:hypothetical protein